MAVFDLAEQRIIVRVVYDGVAEAGKTTNVRHLSNMFGAHRSYQMHTPAELAGRTLYFDWLEIHAGAISGYPLICQLISVPGQIALTERRRHLLEQADVVVYVCDSHRDRATEAIAGLGVFEEVMQVRADPAPLILQANKQDQSEAQRGTELAAALGRPQQLAVEAIATDGVGVMDTFVAAVRAVARETEERSEKNGFRLAVRRAERSSDVLARLEKAKIDPEWGAEMFLRETERLLLANVAAERGEAPAMVQIHRPDLEDRAPATRQERLAARAHLTRPRLPRPDVPAGFIWPAHTGRATLSSLSEEGALDLDATLNAEGRASLELGGHHLSTDQSRRFEDVESARQALVRSARGRTQLGALLVRGTVLVLQPARDSSSWLWVVSPQLELLSDRLGSVATGTGELAAEAAALALQIASQHGLDLDLHPRNLGFQEGQLRYLGEVEVREAFPRLTASLLELAQSLSLAGELGAFTKSLQSKLESEESEAREAIELALQSVGRAA